MTNNKYRASYATKRAVLNFLAESKGPISVSDIAQETGKTPRHIFRALADLIADNRISRCKTPGKKPYQYKVLAPPKLPVGMGAVKAVLRESPEPITAAEIGERCDLSERHVYRVISELERLNTIRRYDGGPHKAYSYEVVA